MKHTHFRIQNGIVVKCGPFDTLAGAIRARTKGEATALFLHRAEAMLANPPRVYVWNGAWMLVTHNGRNFASESGVLIDRPLSAKQCAALCTAHHETLSAAICDSTFAYYASADYQRVRGNQVASLTAERIASAQASQALSDAERERLVDSADITRTLRETDASKARRAAEDREREAADRAESDLATREVMGS